MDIKQYAKVITERLHSRKLTALPSQMNTASQLSNQSKHLRITNPSAWVSRFAPVIPNGGRVLDLACGGGRHSRVFLDNDNPVIAVDKETSAIAERLGDQDDLTIITADLEDGCDPFGENGVLGGLTFDGVVVVNYLYRPLMAGILNAINPGGVLIYETFARGNEEYARPRNPDHLLRSGELLEYVAGDFQVVAYEHGLVEVDDLPGVKQRLVAVRDLAMSNREDGDPPAHRLY